MERDQAEESGRPVPPPVEFVLKHTAVLSGVPVAVELGGHSWGTLNAARDNAVLICHYYTGTSQAAGTRPDGTLGWWSELIGPGCPVDTDRFYVVALNTLSNVQSHDPEVVTTGPGTLHPDGDAWGERFPAWDFADLHALQWALLRQIGAERWHAVIGPSFGGMQALQWAARSPELAPRVAAIAASPYAGPALRDAFGPLMRDVAVTGGLEGALRLISLFGFGAAGLERNFREADFGVYLQARSITASLPHILDIARVVVSHDLFALLPKEDPFAPWRGAGLRLLTVNIRDDQFFPAAEMQAFAALTRAAGVAHTHLEFSSPHGHLGCVMDTAPFADRLRCLMEDGLSAGSFARDVAERGETPHA